MFYRTEEIGSIETVNTPSVGQKMSHFLSARVKESGRKSSGRVDPSFLYWIYNKMWVERVVECGDHLPKVVKVKCDFYYWTGQKIEMRYLMADGWSNKNILFFILNTSSVAIKCLIFYRLRFIEIVRLYKKKVIEKIFSKRWILFICINFIIKYQ